MIRRLLLLCSPIVTLAHASLLLAYNDCGTYPAPEVPNCLSGRVLKKMPNNTEQPAINFTVRACKVVGAAEYCRPYMVTLTDGDGVFRMAFARGSDEGTYRFYAHSPSEYWGAPARPVPPWIATFRCDYFHQACSFSAGVLITYPAPLPPAAVSPVNGSDDARPGPCPTDVVWTSGVDANRSGWPVTYDLWGGGGGESHLVVAGLTSTRLDGFQLDPNVPYNWQVVAKMRVGSDSWGNPIYNETSSPVYTFQTNAQCFHGGGTP